MTRKNFRGGDPIRALVSGYSSDVRAKKLLVATQAYIDDSASDDGDRRLLLAGYINSASNWALFSDAWAEELAAAPSINYLKMSEAKAMRGEFRGWSRDHRDEKVRQLARIIRHFQPTSIHCSVSRNEVEEIIKPVAPYGLSGPYGYCFSGLMLPIAAQLAREGSKIPIDFIFDSQGGLGDLALRIYKMMRECQPKAIQDVLSVDPLFRDDKLVLPLQAADMLAWHVRRRAEEEEEDSWFVPDYLFVEDGHHIATDIQKEHLQKIADGLSEIPVVPELRNKSVWKKTMRELDS